MVNVGKAAKKRKSAAGGEESAAVSPKKPNLDATQTPGKNKTPVKQQSGTPQQKGQNKTPAKKPQPGPKTPQQKGGDKTQEKKLKVFPGTGNLAKKNEKTPKPEKEEDEEEEDESSESEYEETDETKKVGLEEDDDEDDDEEVEEEESDDDEEEEESEEDDDDDDGEDNAEQKKQAKTEKKGVPPPVAESPFVVVKNLDRSLKQQDVENLFKPVVDFDKVILNILPTGLNFGTAYVQLKNENDIRKALSLHQTKVNDKFISIYIGRKDYVFKKRPFQTNPKFKQPFSPRGRGGLNRGRGGPRGGRGGPGARGGPRGGPAGRGGFFKPQFHQQQPFGKRTKQNGVNKAQNA